MVTQVLEKTMLSLEHEEDGDDLFYECVRRGKRHFKQTIGIGHDLMSIYCQRQKCCEF